MENQDPNMQPVAALPAGDAYYAGEQQQWNAEGEWQESTEKAKKVKKSKKEKKKKKDRSRSRSRSRKKKSKKSKKRAASSDIDEEAAAKKRASFMSKGGFSGGFTGDQVASPATTSATIPGIGTYFFIIFRHHFFYVKRNDNFHHLYLWTIIFKPWTQTLASNLT